MHESTYTFELVAAFLHALEAEGYPIGTGAYLNIQEVMTQLPEDISDDALRDSLIPILATNEQEQHLFRSLFKRAQRQVKTLRVESDMMQQGSTIITKLLALRSGKSMVRHEVSFLFTT